MTLVTERVCSHCQYIDPSGGGYEALIAEAYNALLVDLNHTDPYVRLEAAIAILEHPPIFDLGEGQPPWIPLIQVVETDIVGVIA